MKNIYHIGRFEFDSYTEYKKGLEDVKKIKYISDELDINEPGVALRLYTLVRQKEIRFQSIIGEDYLLYLSDLVADDYEELKNNNADGYVKSLAVSGRERSPRRIVGILCIIAAILCFAYFLGSEYISFQKTREIKEIQENKEISQAAQYIADVINRGLKEETKEQVEEEEHLAEAKPVQEEQEEIPLETAPEILPEYTGLHEQNPDMAGWLKIADTGIDYPIMQSADTSDFYLTHNFEKQEDVNGSIFMDSRNNYIDRDDNLIIYGHNMKSGLMFGSLKNYLDEEYWRAHRTIEFHTLYKKEEYDIIAVCLAQVEYQDEDVFRYYNFLNADKKSDFEEYKKNIEKLNVIEGDLDLEYGDKLLTLSTCNNYIEDGRLFLVAKRRN